MIGSIIGPIIGLTTPGGGGGPPPVVETRFVSTWDTTQAGSASGTIILPMTAGNLVDWGDGSEDSLNTHTYSVGGIYTIKIDGAVTGFRFNNGGDKSKIITITNWGNFYFDNDRIFQGCNNLLLISAIDTPSISTSSLVNTFHTNSSLLSMSFIGWPTGSVTSLSGFMINCTSIQSSNFSGWDVGSVDNMLAFAEGCSAATSYNFSGWQTTSLLNLIRAFNGNSLLKVLDLTMFDVSLVTSMAALLDGVALDTASYDAMLIGFESQAVHNNVDLNGGGSLYSAGAAATARQALIDDHTWTITDGGQVP